MNTQHQTPLRHVRIQISGSVKNVGLRLPEYADLLSVAPEKLAECIDSIVPCPDSPGHELAPPDHARHIARALACLSAGAYWDNNPQPAPKSMPPSGKVVGREESSMIMQAGLDAWLTAGRFNDSFEKGLSELFGLRKCITVNSGSSANLAAVSALTSPLMKDRRLMPGDEIITAAAGFPTTINPILQNGLVPVFVDSELITCNIDPAAVEAAIGPDTRAIFAAHTLGNPMDMHALARICQKHGLLLIEDCCDALGSKFDGQNCGAFGLAATCSFYPAHHITMGEGGAVLSNDLAFMRAAESFRDWGRDCFCPPGKDNTCNNRFTRQMGQLPYGYDHKYTYSHIGYNLKISDMQAACGLAQLDKAAAFIQRRKDNHALLLNALRNLGLDEDLILPGKHDLADPSWFGFLMLVRNTGMRADLVAYLEQKGIGTRLLFAGNATRQPSMQDAKFRISGSLDNADLIMNNAFWIGIWPGLSESQILAAAEAIGIFFGKGW